MPKTRGWLWTFAGAGLLVFGLVIGLTQAENVLSTNQSTQSSTFDSNPFDYPVEWLGIVMAIAGLALLLGITARLVVASHRQE